MESKVSTSLRFGVRQIAVVGMLSAIIIVMGATGIGFIPVPPIKATIMHLPVIIGAIIEGPVVGALIGLIFGLFSMFQALTAPTAFTFPFLNPIVAIIPRVLIGIISYYVYRAIPGKSKVIKSGISAIVGTMTNTVGVLGLIYLLYLDKFAAAREIDPAQVKGVLVGIATTQGIPEALVAAAIVVPVVVGVKRIRMEK